LNACQCIIRHIKIDKKKDREICRRVDENTYDKKAIAIKKNIRKKERREKRDNNICVYNLLNVCATLTLF